MIGQSATGQGHEIFNLSEKELVYKQKVVWALFTSSKASGRVSILRKKIIYA